MRLALLLMLALLATLAAADPLAGLRFLDGKERRLDGFPGQTVVLVRFCGHCPTAREFIAKRALELATLIEREHLAGQVVCITPDLQGPELAGYITSVAPALLDTALIAHDPINADKIGLQNILQQRLYVDGVRRPYRGGAALAEAEALLRASTGWRYPVEGLEGKPRELWWAVERGRAGALRAAIAAKRDPAIAKIVAAVQAVLDKRQEALLAAPADLDTYERLESLLAEGEGLDLKPALERLKALAKDPLVKKELQARSLYRECQRQTASRKPKEQEAGKANLAQLAARMPDTVYGRRAAER